MTVTPFTLLRSGNPLADAGRQRELLEKVNGLPRFEDSLNGLSPLSTTSIEVLQVNVGKLCNQTCRHCHVDAGPDRKEIMTMETARGLDYAAIAGTAAAFLLKKMRKDGRLLRSYQGGRAHLKAYVEDYAFFIAGLLDLQ